MAFVAVRRIKSFTCAVLPIRRPLPFPPHPSARSEHRYWRNQYHVNSLLSAELLCPRQLAMIRAIFRNQRWQNAGPYRGAWNHFPLDGSIPLSWIYFLSSARSKCLDTWSFRGMYVAVCKLTIKRKRMRNAHIWVAWCSLRERYPSSFTRCCFWKELCGQPVT